MLLPVGALVGWEEAGGISERKSGRRRVRTLQVELQ